MSEKDIETIKSFLLALRVELDQQYDLDCIENYQAFCSNRADEITEILKLFKK